MTERVDLRTMASDAVQIIVERGKIRTAQPAARIIPSVESKSDHDNDKDAKVNRWLRWVRALRP
jgi:hypothetical protein